MVYVSVQKSGGPPTDLKIIKDPQKRTPRPSLWRLSNTWKTCLSIWCLSRQGKNPGGASRSSSCPTSAGRGWRPGTSGGFRLVAVNSEVELWKWKTATARFQFGCQSVFLTGISRCGPESLQRWSVKKRSLSSTRTCRTTPPLHR